MKLEGYQPGPEHCKQKWASLALDFQHHKAEAEATGTVPLWPYYIRVRHVMNLVGLPKQGELCSDVPLSYFFFA